MPHKKLYIVLGAIVCIFLAAFLPLLVMPSVKGGVDVSDSSVVYSVLQTARTHFDNPFQRALASRYQIIHHEVVDQKDWYRAVGKTLFGVSIHTADVFSDGSTFTFPSFENDIVTPGNEILNQVQDDNPDVELTAADRAGMTLSAGRCEGTDKPKLTHLPMDMEDFSMIIPYGMTAGGHVTPIDHQYFSPADYNSPLDAYEVYAMADSRIVAIGPRPRIDKDGNPFEEYRMIFSMSCRLLYYYDLVTSLAPDLKAAYERDGNNINFPVKAGQLIGYIGGQTLDFAVWDTEKPLTGYVVPEHYESEGWKIYTADPLDYYADELKEQALSKYIRTAEPRSGRIDHDIDGKLIGNWFQQNTDGTTSGYSDTGGEYWTTHVSFSPDHIDPTGFIISIGNWPGGATQFSAKGNTPDPATVGVETGLVKYDLRGVNYRDSNGNWDRMSLKPPITFEPGIEAYGCALVQLTDSRELKVEVFKGSNCSSVFGFTDAAVMYMR